MAFFFINRCYDSHVHWPEVGEVLSYADLSELTSIEALEKKLKSVKAQLTPNQWVRGFGWDQFKFENTSFLTKEFLDHFFPDHPVSFIRADGHSSWVNSKALMLAGLSNETETGVLSEKRKQLVDQCTPASTDLELKNYFLQGQVVFANAGFTHIRDMDFDPRKWAIASQIESQGDLQLFAEVNFCLKKTEELASVLSFIKEAIAESKIHRQLRVAGLKFYVDGSLGSETALISKPYFGSTNYGVQLFSDEEIESIICQCWSAEIPVAAHALGDLAVEKLVSAALAVQENYGLKGALNIEHAELISDSSIRKMSLLRVRVHMQPSHFISDKKWIKNKIDPLKKYLFRWADLENSQIPFSFGSDAPVEKPSIVRAMQGLNLAKQDGVTEFFFPAEKYFEHPDQNWGSGCSTQFHRDGRILRHFKT